MFIGFVNCNQKLSNQGIHTGGGHHRMLSGELIWCLKCGAYGNGKAIALRWPCTGDPRATWTDGKSLTIPPADPSTSGC